MSGHVDGVGRIVAREIENDSVRYVFEVPAGIERFIARKGSIAINGVSLTVNEVEGNRFGVNIIPHTQAETTFGRDEGRRSGQSGDRHAGALRGPSGRAGGAMSFADILSPIADIIEDARQGRLFILVGRRGSRE